MSHVAEMDMEIKDLEALDAACKQMGLELVRDQKTYKWWGHSVGDYPLPKGFKEQDLGKCDHAIRIPGNREAYEIGVMPRRDGRPGFTMLWDFYNGGYGMEKMVGHEGNKLKQEYAVQTAMKNVPRGYRVSRERQADGRVFIRCRK